MPIKVLQARSHPIADNSTLAPAPAPASGGNRSEQEQDQEQEQAPLRNAAFMRQKVLPHKFVLRRFCRSTLPID